MNIYKTNLFPYIIGDSLVDKNVTLTMVNVATEKIMTHNNKSEDKLVLYFKESDKGLILNKTNCKTIATLYGPETEDWNGKPITLYSEIVKAFGQEYNAIRIAPAIPEMKPVKKAKDDKKLFDDADTKTKPANALTES